MRPVQSQQTASELAPVSPIRYLGFAVHGTLGMTAAFPCGIGGTGVGVTGIVGVTKVVEMFPSFF